MDKNAIAGYFLKKYDKIRNYALNSYERKPFQANFPIFQESEIKQLLSFVTEIFITEPVVLNVSSNTVVIGDLHGHIFDLFRILNYYRNFDEQLNFLFLGDLIDRGNFSLGTILYIFALKVCYPKRVWIIRGNHEFSQIFISNGFAEDLSNYSVELIYEFSQTFSYIPFAAIIDNYALCVHGGIGPSVKSVKDIQQIKRPVSSFEQSIVTDLVWSDPSMTKNDFTPSVRGSGWLFGTDVISNFLKESDLEILIRGHQCISSGVSLSNNKKVITIFSASNYCGTEKNLGAALLLASDHKMKIHTFKPLPNFKKTDFNFVITSMQPYHHPTPIEKILKNEPNEEKFSILRMTSSSFPRKPLGYGRFSLYASNTKFLLNTPKRNFLESSIPMCTEKTVEIFK